jgi:hypothetical protein
MIKIRRMPNHYDANNEHQSMHNGNTLEKILLIVEATRLCCVVKCYNMVVNIQQGSQINDGFVLETNVNVIYPDPFEDKLNKIYLIHIV